MGGIFASISSKYLDCIDSKEDKMICIICNNKIIDYHCCTCENCKSLSHINCQSRLKIKNKCKLCEQPLKIYTPCFDNINKN
jgi:hypothetical protein